MTALDLRQVSFSYESAPVIRNLSLALPVARLTGLMGANASGKTTLLKLMAGILHPSSGEILINGRPINRLKFEDRAQAVAYVPQEFAPAFPFTVREVALLGRSLISPGWFYDSPSNLRIADDALATVG
ncbi:MAG: ATP-binding cassette domain-containing protein, partial [bacterium]